MIVTSFYCPRHLSLYYRNGEQNGTKVVSDSPWNPPFKLVSATAIYNPKSWPGTLTGCDIYNCSTEMVTKMEPNLVGKILGCLTFKICLPMPNFGPLSLTLSFPSFVFWKKDWGRFEYCSTSHTYEENPWLMPSQYNNY